MKEEIQNIIPDQRILNIPSGRSGKGFSREGLAAMNSNAYLLFPDKPKDIMDHSKFCPCTECLDYYGEL